MEVIRDESLQFLEDYPDYARTEIIDHMRSRDYQRLDREGHVYVDYGGASLYSEAVVDEGTRFLKNSVLGNPHSSSRAASTSTFNVDEARFEVLSFFNADPDEYVVIFTSNASAAIKLVGESFPFSLNSPLAILEDNHNSVLGLRCFAKKAGAKVLGIPIKACLTINKSELENTLSSMGAGKSGLFVYPAQSNYSGVKHSLDYVAYAEARGWHTLLDVAAFVPTSQFDMSVCKPSFVALSFYKMFGFPTGMGCLLAKRSSLLCLARPWFSGGSVLSVSARVDHHLLAVDEAGFEDGTVNFASAYSVVVGLRHLQSIGYATLNDRLRGLTEWLISTLNSLKHDNETQVIRIYGPADWMDRGATIALNVINPDGEKIDFRIVEAEANKRNISLRAGTHCNPGANERAMELDDRKLMLLYKNSEEELEEFLFSKDMLIGGVVRISLGIVSNFSDVSSVADLFKYFRNWKK